MRGIKRACKSSEGSKRRFKTCSIVESGSDCSDEAGGSDIVFDDTRDNDVET